MAKVVALASDHGGYQLKMLIKTYLDDKGYQFVDLGCENSESVDYPDYADKLAQAIAEGVADTGILLCGSGIGISMAANRHKHIRAALVHDVTTARLCREHNDANVLALGERVIGIETAKQCVEAFLKTDFVGGRHQNRIKKMS